MWVKKRGPQVVVQVSIYQGSIFGIYLFLTHSHLRITVVGALNWCVEFGLEAPALVEDE